MTTAADEPTASRCGEFPTGLRRIRDSLSPDEADTLLEDRERGLLDAMQRTVSGIKTAAEA